MSRPYDKTGKPLQFPREIEIEKLIRRIRNSGLLFDPDDVKADKDLGKIMKLGHLIYLDVVKIV